MNKIMVALLGMSAIAVSTPGIANTTNTDETASTAGIYLNADLGYGDFIGLSKASNVTYKKTGFVWGGDLGYQFNQYVGAEVGYLNLPSIKQSVLNKVVSTSDQYAFYATLKGIYPVSDSFDAFAKAGAAYMHSKKTISGQTTSIGKWTPVVGAGVDYNLNSNVGFDVETLYTFKASNVPSSIAGLVGLNYKLSF